MTSNEYITIYKAVKSTNLSHDDLVTLALNKELQFYIHRNNLWRAVSIDEISKKYRRRNFFKPPSTKDLIRGYTDEYEYHLLKSDIKDYILPQVDNESMVKSDLTKTQLCLPCDHEFKPPWLEIAMKCWIELYSEAPSGSKSIRKKHIKEWIKKNYPGTSSNALEIISTVVNPHKEGGATPTE